MGPPGAGKGTQAQLMEESFRLQPVSPGDLLRREVHQGTSLGRQAQEFMDAGQLVPDSIILRLVAAELDRLEPSRGFLFDGFPRSSSQAAQLDKLLSERSRGIACVILLELEDAAILGRLSLRRVCPACARSYHLEQNPPRVEGQCDDDGTSLIQRSDDREEVIGKRLEVYHQSTAPVVEHYRQQGLVRAIDASQAIETVREQVAEILGACLF